MRLMEWITAVMNNNLIMVSEEQTNWFATEYGKKCVTIPTAVNLPNNFDNTGILKKYNLTPNEYYLYLGRLVQDKNPDYLIKAFLKADIKDAKLVIAGANDTDKEYVEYLHGLANNDNRVIFTGAVYGLDKETLLKNCKVFCIPSTIEGLAITLLEAMSYAKPVIASDIEANKEGLGENGIWVKVEDIEDLSRAIEFCEVNINILKIEANNNRIRIEKYFTWEHVSRLYDDCIKTICK